MNVVRRRVEEARPLEACLLVLLVVLPLYLLGATYDREINIDAGLAALPAWQLVEHGTLDLSAYRQELESGPLGLTLLTDSEEGLFSSRNPGVVFWAVPFYFAAAPWVPGTWPVAMWPSAIAAVVAAAAAVVLMHLVLRRLLEPWHAFVGSLVGGLGTATWAVSADGLWTHGPSQMWVMAGVLAMASARHLGAGLAFGAALLTRPYDAVVAATSGLWQSARTRSVTPALLVGAGSGLGLLLYLLYGQMLTDSTGLGGAYAELPYVASATDVSSRSVSNILRQFVGAFIDPERGMLWYSPFLWALLPGLRRGWKAAPDWVRGVAIGAIPYLLLQYYVQNQSQGGSFLFGYRYPLEPLTMAAPLLALSWRETVLGHPRREQVFRILVVVAVALQAFGAIFEPYKWG